MGKKSLFIRFLSHSRTINKHKFLVTSLCFKSGLIKQGLLHDLSKYSPVEFFNGVRFYQGYRSPIDKERETYGYSMAWLHHAGRNRHHWEYWVDKDYRNVDLITIKMPFNYVLESICDKIAASKVYKGQNYNDQSAYQFFINGRDKLFMHPDNARQVDILLKYLADNGEKATIQYYHSLYKQWKKDHSFEL